MIKYVSKQEFQNMVELWESKGHNNVVGVTFNSATVVLSVPDYVDPTISYKLSVIDTETADKELSSVTT